MIINKKLNYHITIVIMTICTITGCIEPFEPNINEFNALLVVEGYLNTEKASGKVILSTNYPYNEKEGNDIKDAIVILFDDLGNYYNFNYSEQTNYTIEDTTFNAEIGRSYKIHIELSNGDICESSFTKIMPPVEFDTMHFNYVDTNSHHNGGLQFYIDLNNQSSVSDYFAWDYTETWEFRVPLETFTNRYPRTCYRHHESNEIIFKSTIEFSDKQIKSLPLFLLHSPTEKFEIKYSLIVNQHTITKEDYQFYKELKETHEENGTIYDKTPNALIGNLAYTNNKKTHVLGNFRVSSISSKRISLTKMDLPDGIIHKDEFAGCRRPQKYIYPDQSGQINSIIDKGGVVYDVIPNPGKTTSTYYITGSMTCCDCSTTGTIIKPKFWDNE